MVAGEEEALPVEQAQAARGVAGGGDGQEVGARATGLVAFDVALEAAQAVGAMHEALAAEALVGTRVVGHVVAMGEHQSGDPAPLVEASRSGPRPAASPRGRCPAGRSTK